MAGERVLTLRELNRALLERQLLLQRRRLSVQQAVERLCALQAQYSPSPYIALWSRVEGFKKEQLTKALEQKRVVRSSLFRITLHITSARDYPYFAAAWLHAAQARTPGLDTDKVAAAVARSDLARDQAADHDRGARGARRRRAGRLSLARPRTRPAAPRPSERHAGASSARRSSGR